MIEDNKKITIRQIEKFLYIVDKCFPIPLSEKTDISIYAKKLKEKATICVEKDKNGNILSMCAGYTENTINAQAYISLVATLPESQGQGYGKKLVKEFLDIAKRKFLRGAHVYAVESNISAMKIYESLGFTRWNLENEPRPKDVHLIYRF